MNMESFLQKKTHLVGVMINLANKAKDQFYELDLSQFCDISNPIQNHFRIAFQTK